MTDASVEKVNPDSPAMVDALQQAATVQRSLTRDVWDQFKTHKGALFGTFIFFIILCFK